MNLCNKGISLIFGSAWLLCAALPAHANAIFEFDIDFDTTPPGSVTGTLEVDSNFTGTGGEIFTPDGTQDGVLLSFDITVDGVTFAASDADGYPGAPTVYFIDGVLDQIIYVGVVADSELWIDYDVTNTVNFVWVGNAGATPSDEGNVVATRRVGGTVPEPSVLALLPLSLAGIGYRRHRSKKAA